MNNNERSAAMRGVLLALGAAVMIISGCGAPPSPSGDKEGVTAQGTISLAFSESTDPKCGFCHSGQADAKYEAYGPSVHNTIAAATKNSSGDVRQRCSKCHTDEGAKLYLDKTPSQLSMSVALAGANPIQCDTCHDSHGSKALLEAAGTDKFTNTASDQYMTCTNCHEEQGALHGETSSYSYSAGIFDAAEIIYDTHFDNAATKGIEGYVINSAVEDACRDCHNVHSADVSINEQWARSGHGGFILDVKDAAFQNAPGAATANANVVAVLMGTDPYSASTAAGFYSNDFKSQLAVPPPSKKPCQRCHTSTGYRNFASSPALYDADKNDTPDVNNTFYATGEQREMIYCWACHTSAETGVLRDPGVLQSYMTLNAPMARLMNVPDVDGSNVCIACHSGRRTAEQHIKNAAVVAGSNFGTFDPHYMLAASVLYRYSGYEYRTSADYDDYSYFTHGRIGNSIAVGGKNGPCVACHMRSDEGHKMEGVTPAAPAAITNIPTYEQTCSSCHSSKATLITDLNAKRTGFDDALVEIKTKLAGLGIYYDNSAYPYFFSDAVLRASANRYTAWPNKDTLGAAFNLFMLDHEPGAYVHNSRYAKRLLYDTFDFLDDGTQNNSVTAVDVPDPDAYQFIGSGTRP